MWPIISFQYETGVLHKHQSFKIYKKNQTFLSKIKVFIFHHFKSQKDLHNNTSSSKRYTLKQIWNPK
jgi:hypothetical protein